MKKLFFALNATEPLATSFLPTYKKLRINADKKEIVIKWVPADNYHITLIFLGNRPAEQLLDLEETLKEICANHSPFDLKIEDVGAFSSEHDARVLWLGVQNKKILNTLKNDLEERLIKKDLLNLQSDERDYVPHLTFARLKNPKSVKDMISPFKRKSFGKIHVDEVILYESKMQGHFPVYIPLFRCKLPAPVNDDASELHTHKDQ